MILNIQTKLVAAGKTFKDILLKWSSQTNQELISFKYKLFHVLSRISRNSTIVNQKYLNTNRPITKYPPFKNLDTCSENVFQIKYKKFIIWDTIIFRLNKQTSLYDYNNFAFFKR